MTRNLARISSAPRLFTAHEISGLKLRQDTVRTLPFAHENSKQQCIYWDESFECFGVRVYPSGRRLYVCSYRVERRKRIAALGRVDVLTLDQVRKKATAYLGEAASNKDPQDGADKLRTSSSVREVIEAYIEGHAKKKNKELERRPVVP